MMTATAADVLVWLDTDAGNVDADELDRLFAVAVSTLADDYDLQAAEPDRADQAAVMYCGRLYRRKYSVNGVEATNDFGVLRVSVTDPDIHMLLKKWELIRFG